MSKHAPRSSAAVTIALDPPAARTAFEVRVTVTSKAVTGLRLVVEHVLGRATALVEAAPGELLLPVDLSRLPAGPAAVEVTALRSDGSAAGTAREVFGVPGAAGAAPALRSISLAHAALQRPARRSAVRPAITVRGAEGVAALHVALTLDGERVDEALVAPPADDVPLRPLALPGGARPGTYAVEVTPVGPDGAVGKTLAARLVVGEKGPAAPVVRGARFGRDGTLVLRGAGFDRSGLAVFVGGVPAPVARVADDELAVLAAPVGAVDVVVQTDVGTGAAARPVTPPVTVVVEPALRVAEGSETVLHAAVTGTPDGTVAWSLPGEPADVSLAADGTLRIGFGAPDAFTARATSAAHPDRSADIAVTVAAAGAPRRHLGTRGGTVESADGRARLVLAERSLAEPTEIAFAVHRRRTLRKGRAARTEVHIGARPLEVAATLEIELDHPVEPSATVPVHVEAGGVIKDVLGHADPSGRRLEVILNDLPDILRVDLPHHHWDDLFGAASSLPVISRLSPASVEEGDTVAVLVEGSNFVPGATVISVVRNGVVDQRVECGGPAISRNGTRLGVTVRVQPMTDLAEGATSWHELRVSTPAGSATFPLPIIGHDELDVTPGMTVRVTGQRRFSRMIVDWGGTVVLAPSGPTPPTVEVLSTAWIGGRLRVEAADGSTGARGTSGGAGGAGGVATLGGGGSGGTSVADAGSPGAAGTSTTLQTGGAGGFGGAWGGGGPFPHAGEPGGKGFTPANPRPVFPARSSDNPRAAAGAGGGGGGAGGAEGWIFVTRGGGGGGGGAGSPGLGLVAGEGIDLYGQITAAGGTGGRGGTAGDQEPGGVIYWSSGAGGGGGGGGGGGMVLQGLSIRGANAYAIAVTGRTGPTPGQAIQVNPYTEIGELMTRPPTGDIRVDGFLLGTSRPEHTPGPDLFYLRDLVSPIPTIEVRGTDATHVRVTGSMGPVVTPIGQTMSGLPFTSVNTIHITTVPLRDGFNDIVAEAYVYSLPEEGAAPLMASAPLRSRRVLHIADAVAAYRFACAITPAAVTVPTERSQRFTAQITADQPTRALWSVVQGAQAGAITPELFGGGAVYVAPTRPMTSPALVRASSDLDPSRSQDAPVTVVPGVAIASTPTLGTARDAALPAANCGQTIEIRATAEGLAATPAGFAGVASVEVTQLQRVQGACARNVLAVAAVPVPGLQAVNVTLPACSDPEGWVRVPGHGSARLQIVPTITSVLGDRSADPAPTLRGTGFACGVTEVLVDGTPLAASEVVSMTCSTLELRQWPLAGASVAVRSTGGTSNPVTV